MIDAHQLAVLRALAETFVPLETPVHLLAAFIAERVAAPAQRDLGRLLGVLAKVGFQHLPRSARERVALPALRRLSRDVGMGLEALRQIVLLVAYGDPASWPAIGFPGGPARNHEAAPLPVGRPPASADVVVIGSGAGGSVIAAELAQAGRSVVVLEAGQQLGAYPRSELDAFGALYWRGHYQRTADNIVGMGAGATLGGGTTVNWSNCYPTPAEVRAEWAAHGLDDIGDSRFDVHLAAVAERAGITGEVSEDCGANAILRRGAERFGLFTRRTLRNADASRYDPDSAGHMGLGDRSGSKLATTATYLRDAVAHGARIAVGCRAERVVSAGGRAVAVRATFAGETISIATNTVIVACGALETPALLLRSGIGGPAVGQYLRLHPVVGMVGTYTETVAPWRGAPQTTQITHYLERGREGGFLVECPAYHPGLLGSVMPYASAREHRQLMLRGAHLAPFIARIRERGAGRVTIDGAGEAVVHYPMTDLRDREHLAEALGVLARVQEAAGADEVFALGGGTQGWRRSSKSTGDRSLDAFIASQVAIPIRAGGRNFMSAHQMGTARMGRDPETSVADVRGELHTTRGVWIGDGSAFPTASGANPMWSIMALARRTALAIIAG